MNSDFARGYSAEVAAAASTGLITTRLPNGAFVRNWLITPDGLRYLTEAA